MQLRKAAVADMPAVETIHHENHRDQGRMLISPLYPDADYYVLEDRGEIVAYAAIAQGPPDRIGDTALTFPRIAVSRDSIHIRQIAVSFVYQGQGIGTRLYCELAYLFPGKDFYSYVRDSNDYSLQFHRANGFFKVGTYQAPDFHGVPDYRAHLMLCPGAPVLPS